MAAPVGGRSHDGIPGETSPGGGVQRRSGNHAEVETTPIVEPPPVVETTPVVEPPSSTAAPPAPSMVGPVMEAHCVVPKLKGKKLKRAKRKLRASGCRLGKVRKEDGATARTGKVVRQGARSGTVLAAGSKVTVALKP